MFGNKENVNILTALLVAHGVRRAVVCPGSRNAPIAHNLNECEGITCYPVTDERSAGFYALGMSLADDAPVAVCVTSGTALLNLAPAVAEASYRHHGLIVISADRPAAWIDQLDGQTLPQVDALGRFVSRCVNLPEPHDNVERWHCNRLVNEALTEVKSHGRKSVHINVPISEPLFEFTTEALPTERTVNAIPRILDTSVFCDTVIRQMLRAEKPLLVVGQINRPSRGLEQSLRSIAKRIAVWAEPLSDGSQRLSDLSAATVEGIDEYVPDFVIYVGDTLVSKRLKQILRNADIRESWAVSEDGGIHDTFMSLIGVVEGDPVQAVSLIASACEQDNDRRDTVNGYAGLWSKLSAETAERLYTYEPPYSQMLAVRDFELSLDDMDYPFHVHYANSNAIRLGCIYASHYIWCNRGVNGIEGSLSVAAGHSVVTEDTVFCVIGDLSFFYDQNALWNTNLKGNLRIILLNNHCGGIFYSLRGAADSGAFGNIVSAAHNATAKGICEQNDICYLSASDTDGLRIGMAQLLTSNTSRPMLLEVFTDAEKDKEAIKGLMKHIRQTSWNKENGKQ